MKALFYLLLLFVGISLAGCSATEQSQSQADSSADTLKSGNQVDSVKQDGVKKDTMPAKRDTV